jgi:acyl-CoA synthetase (AMP-forming)/AMP-acid ligase II
MKRRSSTVISGRGDQPGPGLHEQGLDAPIGRPRKQRPPSLMRSSILLAGGVVPIYPLFRLDRDREYAERQIGILRTPPRVAYYLRRGRTRQAVAWARTSLKGVTTAGQPHCQRAGVAASRTQRRPGAHQYTSGSTGDPKGAAHAREHLGEHPPLCDDQSADVAVSWLPLSRHGVDRVWLTALYFGIPSRFCRRLPSLPVPVAGCGQSAHRATLSAVPNFAFRSLRPEGE